MSASLNIATRALLANQSVLQVVGHNIANANTEGYSRQSAKLTVSGYQQYANGFFGKGVEISTVTRAYDAYLTREAQAASSVSAADAIRLSRLEQLEAAFPMGEAGLGEALNAMLNAWADVASSPDNQTARLVVIARADAFAARMRDTAGQLDVLGESTRLQVGDIVTRVNRLAADLAKVNQKLTEAGGTAHTPNDLLDQRDQLLRDLGQFIQIRTVEADNGVVSVFAGGSMPLVLGSHASEMVAGRDPDDSSRLQIGFLQGGATTPLPDSSLGGQLGGLMTFLNDDLVDTRNLLGRMALATASIVNGQHALGVDLTGSMGADFFVLPLAAQGLGAAGNTGNASLSASVSDPSALMASDYELRVEAGGVSLVRLSDGKVSQFSSPVSWPIEADGLSFGIDAGAAATGDVFRFKPFERAARDLQVALTSPDRLAAGSPVMVTPDTGNSASLSIESLYAVEADPNLGASVTIEFLANGSYSIDGGAPRSFVPGQPIVHNGWSLTLRGTPTPGDSFTVSAPVAGSHPQNTGNASAMLALRDAATFEGVPLSDGYVTLFSDIGTRVQTAQFSAAFSSQVATIAENARANVSGVNLDEEAALLLQYQQSYQAAAKYLQVAQGLFDSLLQSVNG